MVATARITNVEPSQLGNIMTRGKLVGMTRIHLAYLGEDRDSTREGDFIERLQRDEIPLDGTAGRPDVELLKRITASCHAAYPDYTNGWTWDRACARFAGESVDGD